MQPSPLFQKLEQKFIDELKAKFAGAQVNSASSPAAAKAGGTAGVGADASQKEIDSLTEQVAAQVSYSTVGYVCLRTRTV